MAKAMVKTSLMCNWFGWYETSSVRFCRNGHRVPTCMGLRFPPEMCLVCGSPITATFHMLDSEEISISLNPLAFLRKWKSVEVYDRQGDRLTGVRQRIRIPVYDVSQVPAEKWQRNI